MSSQSTPPRIVPLSLPTAPRVMQPPFPLNPKVLQEGKAYTHGLIGVVVYSFGVSCVSCIHTPLLYLACLVILIAPILFFWHLLVFIRAVMEGSRHWAILMLCVFACGAAVYTSVDVAGRWIFS